MDSSLLAAPALELDFLLPIQSYIHLSCNYHSNIEMSPL
jgi:hypothetical protein